MKIVRFSTGGEISYGLIQGDSVRGLIGSPFGRLRVAAGQYPLSEVQLLTPAAPSKIVAVGLNYRAHAQETKFELPKEPLIFLKPSTAVIGPGAGIVYPDSSLQVDYEGELGVVIKKLARNVPPGEAGDYILGYTCVNDVTARDLQKRDGQWTRAKSFDTFAPLGPWIETNLDPSDLKIETRLNGTVKQQSRTSKMIFGVPALVSFISGIMTLLPGDVISTGTPEGIGPMQKGDTVEVAIEGLGTLANRVV